MKYVTHIIMAVHCVFDICNSGAVLKVMHCSRVHRYCYAISFHYRNATRGLIVPSIYNSTSLHLHTPGVSTCFFFCLFRFLWYQSSTVDLAQVRYTQMGVLYLPHTRALSGFINISWISKGQEAEALLAFTVSRYRIVQQNKLSLALLRFAYCVPDTWGLQCLVLCRVNTVFVSIKVTTRSGTAGNIYKHIDLINSFLLRYSYGCSEIGLS